MLLALKAKQLESATFAFCLFIFRDSVLNFSDCLGPVKDSYDGISNKMKLLYFALL